MNGLRKTKTVKPWRIGKLTSMTTTNGIWKAQKQLSDENGMPNWVNLKIRWHKSECWDDISASSIWDSVMLERKKRDYSSNMATRLGNVKERDKEWKLGRCCLPVWTKKNVRWSTRNPLSPGDLNPWESGGGRERQAIFIRNHWSPTQGIIKTKCVESIGPTRKETCPWFDYETEYVGTQKARGSWTRQRT